MSAESSTRAGDGTFTVPPVVLLALPPSSAIANTTTVILGGLGVTYASTLVSTFQASGISIGGIGSAAIYAGFVTYQ